MGARGESGTSQWVRGLVMGLPLALGLAAASAAQDKPPAPGATAVKQPTAATAEAQPTGGMGEGIKVHGHWTIDIKNPDGSLASHHEFENKLLTGASSLGNGLLVGLLGRGASSPGWIIQLGGYLLNGNPCLDDAGLLVPCQILEAGVADPHIDRSVSANLTLHFPVDDVGRPTGSLELSGSLTATRSSAIGSVFTRAYATVTSGTFRTTFVFSGTDLSAPVPFSEGQIVQVKVVFSFS